MIKKIVMAKYLLLPIIIILFLTLKSGSQNNYHDQWPGFRGPGALGFIPDAKPPTEWDLKSGKNIRWETTIPGLGHSCPVIWNDKLFVTTAISGSGQDSLKIGLYGDIDEVKDETIHEFRVFCIDRNSGNILWSQLSHRGIPKTKRHTKSSHANCTPATDGKHLIVFFGSEGLFCYDFSGRLLWKNDLGEMNAGPFTNPEVEWGFASSPVLHKGKVIVQCDFIGDSFLAAIDVETGKEVWRTSRAEVSTWGSPAIVEYEGKTQVVVNGFKHMGGYEFATGKEIWKMSGGGDAPVPTPVFANNLIFINNAHGKWSPIYAVKPTALGDITLGESETSNEYIAWSIKRGGAYMQTPLIYGEYLYNLQWNGLLTVFNSITGVQLYRQNLGSAGGFTASPVAANGRIYCCAEKGDVFVLKAGPAYELLFQNQLGDVVMATPAISGNTLFFRTQHSVVAVGNN